MNDIYKWNEEEVAETDSHSTVAVCKYGRPLFAISKLIWMFSLREVFAAVRTRRIRATTFARTRSSRSMCVGKSATRRQRQQQQWPPKYDICNHVCWARTFALISFNIHERTTLLLICAIRHTSLFFLRSYFIIFFCNTHWRSFVQGARTIRALLHVNVNKIVRFVRMQPFTSHRRRRRTTHTSPEPYPNSFYLPNSIFLLDLWSTVWRAAAFILSFAFSLISDTNVQLTEIYCIQIEQARVYSIHIVRDWLGEVQKCLSTTSEIRLCLKRNYERKRMYLVGTVCCSCRLQWDCRQLNRIVSFRPMSQRRSPMTMIDNDTHDTTIRKNCPTPKVNILAAKPLKQQNNRFSVDSTLW